MKQITDRVFMVRPKYFGYNTETAENNTFQSKPDNVSAEAISAEAIREFDLLVSTLRKNGIEVDVIEDTGSPKKPDAVFPNNWMSTHEDGAFITYPMFSELRRLERRDEIVDAIAESYQVNRRYTFEQYEEKDQFLEGTGSMVLDRQHKILYACLSVRTDIRMLDKFCVLRGWSKVVFTAVSDEEPIYHTNVMMALGDAFVVICMESIPSEEERADLYKSFKQTGKEVIEISLKQMNSYAGNMLQLQSANGQSILVMSERAYGSLYKKQIKALEKYTTLISSPIGTIENYGGGSVRCMIAENFLTVRNH